MSNAEALYALLAARLARPAIRKRILKRKVKGARWSAAAEKVFLKTLAVTCNVKASATAAGFSTEACYKQRMRRPDFAADWARALEQGYERLEDISIDRYFRRGSLSERRIDTDGSRHAKDDQPTNAVILTLLRVHQDAVRGQAARCYRVRRQ